MRAMAGLLALAVAAWPGASFAQMTLPDDAATAPDGATLFLNQCGTCHTAEGNAAPRQGPNLAGVFGRKAGRLPGFTYSAGLAKADWSWDAAMLDRWLTNPQAMVPDAVMLYRQADPATRKLIIDWLKEQR